MKILPLVLLLTCAMAARGQTVFCEMYVLNGWTNEVVLQFKDANFVQQSLTLPVGGRFQTLVPTGSALVTSFDPASFTIGPYDIPYYRQQTADVTDETTNDWIILIGCGAASESGNYSMQWTEYRAANLASQFGFVPPSTGNTWPSHGQQVADVVQGFEFGVGPAFLLFAIYMIRRGLQPLTQD